MSRNKDRKELTFISKSPVLCCTNRSPVRTSSVAPEYFQIIFGLGAPNTRHVNVTLLPSATFREALGVLIKLGGSAVT